jgi:hypothetical protein
MSRHVRAHRWADAEAGRLSADQLARAEAHARDCDACARGRERVRAAREAMASIATDEPEDVRWDEIGAQIYWTTSSERRTRGAGLRAWRPLALVGVTAAVAAGIVGYLALRGDEAEPVALEMPGVAPEPAPVAPEAVPLPAESVQGVVTVAQGEVTLDGKPLELDRAVGAGHILATGAHGRVFVQFDDDSVFALGANTTLELTAFDSRRVQLDVRGTIDVQLSHRSPEQRFAVGAGERDVVVRGTVFRVVHGGEALEVACTRGRVSVVQGDDSTDVRAGEQLSIIDALSRSAAAKPIPERELAQLTRALEMPVLPVWAGARDALDTTARLDIEAPVASAVVVDGIGVGWGSLAMRVAPGRHHVEGAGNLGEWIEVGAGSTAVATLVRNKKHRKSIRGPQLERELRKRRRRLAQCAKSLAVHGIVEGSFVTLEIGVNKDGSQGLLNIVDSNVPAATARCVRDVVDGIELPRGPRETFRKTIPFR